MEKLEKIICGLCEAMARNYGAKVTGSAVCDMHGKIYCVVEILGYDMKTRSNMIFSFTDDGKLENIERMLK